MAEVEVVDTQTSEYLEALPDTFKVNTPQEKRALKLAENFRQQYAFLYPNRMPLLLAPTNEANTEKVICTYVIPTLIRYVNFFEWQDIANYIRNAFNLKYEHSLLSSKVFFLFLKKTDQLISPF